MSWPDEKRPEHFKSRGPSAASKRDPFAPRTEAQKGKVVLGPERPAAFTYEQALASALSELAEAAGYYVDLPAWNNLTGTSWQFGENPPPGFDEEGGNGDLRGALERARAVLGGTHVQP